MNEQKRKFAIWKLHEEKPQKIDNFKTDVFVKVDETPSENVNAIHKCDCKFTLQNIKESGNISEEKKVRHLIEVIRKDHKSKTHHKVQQECVSLIANAVSKEGASEIMKTILEISEQVYEAYLHELCHLKRWEELHKILKSYRGKLSNSSLQMLARNCSIDTLIETVEKEETIVELLEVFMEGGKIAVGDHDILVKDLLKREMFRILRVLFHNDIDPILLSFYPGDTPIHAAVCIGLKFEHENYAIFEDFVKMYNRDKMNYKCLNPCQLDNNGKSLDEIISNEPEISRSRKLKVMEILKANGYQEEKMSTNEKIERLEQQLLDEISKLTPGILAKLNLRPIGNISLEKTNQKNKSEMECQAHETTSSFNEVDLKSFESLPWEIECTSGFKKAINSRHVPVQTRKRAFECIKMLAEGYREPHLCKALRHNGNQDIKLFEIKLDKAVRII